MTGVKMVTGNVVLLELTAGWVKIDPGVVEGGGGAAGSAAGCCCCSTLTVVAGVVSWTGFDAVTGTVSATDCTDVGVTWGTDAVWITGISGSSCLIWEGGGSSVTDAGDGVDVEIAEASALGSEEGSSGVAVETDSSGGEGSGSGAFSVTGVVS